MSSTSYRQLTLNGLWKNNPALVQLLGPVPFARGHRFNRQRPGPRRRHPVCTCGVEYLGFADSRRCLRHHKTAGFCHDYCGSCHRH